MTTPTEPTPDDFLEAYGEVENDVAELRRIKELAENYRKEAARYTALAESEEARLKGKLSDVKTNSASLKQVLGRVPDKGIRGPAV